MLKRLPGRNNRSKGIKVKHILQICLLLGICFWLVYQVEHSHDKKKEFDGNDAKSLVRKMSEDEIPKLGRKDLLPREDNSKSEKRVEEKHGEEERGDEGIKHGEEEQEVEGEVEASKQEEERVDEGNKLENEEQDEVEEENKDVDVDADTDADAEDEGRGGGDDEIDENDQERKEQERDHNEEFIDEEKEFEEESDEKESKTNVNEDKETRVEKESSSEHQDNNDGSQDSHEAREEHYKGDDASSAVTHDVRDTQIISTEAEKVNSENSEFNGLQKEYKTNTTEGDNRNENTSVSMVGEGEIAHNGTSLNVSAGEQKVDSSLSISENSQVLMHSNYQTEAGKNSIMGSNEAGNNLTESSTKASDSSRQSGLALRHHSNPAQSGTVDGATTVEGMKVETSFLELTNNSNIASEFNSTFSTDFEHENATLLKSLDATDAEAAGKILKLNGTAETEDNYTATTTMVDIDASQHDKSINELESKRIVEISDSTNGIDDGIQHDPINSSDIHVNEDAKELENDLDTLLEIKTNGDENVEEAADE